GTILFSDNQVDPAAASRLGGGLGFAFTNDRNLDNTVDTGTNITYGIFSTNFGSIISLADTNEDLSAPAIATLSSGRQVVVFERATSASNHDILLNVVAAAGTSTQFPDSSPLAVEGNASMQRAPSVAASGTQSLITYLDATGTTVAS